MIGFYDYTVVLTYISFTSSIIGIFCAVTGHWHQISSHILQARHILR